MIFQLTSINPSSKAIGFQYKCFYLFGCVKKSKEQCTLSSDRIYVYLFVCFLTPPKRLDRLCSNYQINSQYSLFPTYQEHHFAFYNLKEGLVFEVFLSNGFQRYHLKPVPMAQNNFKYILRCSYYKICVTVNCNPPPTPEKAIPTFAKLRSLLC